MLKEKLNDYLNRKELSKQATKEVVSILEEYNYNSKETTEELVEVLFELKSNVVYEFVCTKFKKVPDEHEGLFIELCQKAITPNKFSHAFCLIVALCKQAKTMEANIILSYLIQNYVLIKKVNKQIYASFDRVMNYEGSECLFAKWSGEDERIKNGYRKLLIEFLKAYPKPEYADNIMQWFNVNDIIIHSSEQEVIALASERLIEEVVNKKGVIEVSSSAKKKESVNLAKIPISQLLEAANEQSLRLYKKIEELETENKELKKGESSVTGKLKSTEISLKTAELTIESLREKIETQENAIGDLNKGLKVSNEKIIELNKVIDELNSKLANVESAYGHAGQQEIDFLKGQIKKRLASEYLKYIELKGKSPDLDYYDILLDMLDEIYHVLSKNGIKFD